MANLGFHTVSPYIKLGKKVQIRNNARIEGVGMYGNVSFNPIIEICDGVHIEQNIHLTCAEKITIGSNTAIAANVTITDINHPYEDISLPIESQPIETHPVVIGEDCKIYNGVVILPGCIIGKHVTIGANSVVTHDIPDYSVAVGAPAIVVKKFNFVSSKWETINQHDNCFIQNEILN